MVLFQPVFHFPSHQVMGRSPLKKGWLEPGSRPPLAPSFLQGDSGRSGASPSRGPERTCAGHVEGVQVCSVVAVAADTVGRPF